MSDSGFKFSKEDGVFRLRFPEKLPQSEKDEIAKALMAVRKASARSELKIVHDYGLGVTAQDSKLMVKIQERINAYKKWNYHY